MEQLYFQQQGASFVLCASPPPLLVQSSLEWRQVSNDGAGRRRNQHRLRHPNNNEASGRSNLLGKRKRVNAEEVATQYDPADLAPLPDAEAASSTNGMDQLGLQFQTLGLQENPEFQQQLPLLSDAAPTRDNADTNAISLSSASTSPRFEADENLPGQPQPRPAQPQRVKCLFCKSNGETAAQYSSHTLMNENNETICPVLFKYVCPRCGKTGKEAHTLKYCRVENKKTLKSRRRNDAAGKPVNLKY